MGEPKLWTFDQLLRERAIDSDQTPLLAFPGTKHGITDYEPIPGSSLHRFVDGAAKVLIERGFSPIGSGAGELVIGICAPTDLDYIVTIFGFIRLGYTPFLLSPRLAPIAVKSLLEEQNSAVLFYSANSNLFRVSVDSLSHLNLQIVLSRGEYDSVSHGESPEFHREGVDPAKESIRRCLMLHSSGSTGLPKPVVIDNQRLMAAGVYAQNATAFITAPFSHSFGLMSYMQAIHKRKTIYAMSGHVPQTHDTLTAAIRAANPEILWAVPYALKLLTERPDGIEAIRHCRFVSSAGSRLPDEVGDMLTEAGVHVGMQFGSTETGLILSSAYRHQGDKAWNYLRPPPHVMPFIQFRPATDGLYECIILDGHKGKTMSNSDDPPNSWRTSDLFIPHPTIPNAWKFMGRMDDRITLLNGEKVLPLTIEGRVRQHPLVREVVVFGIDRQFPGLLLFRAPGTDHITEEDFVEQVWPAVEDANSRSEGFAQIGRECVAVLPPGVDCPITDKSSIKRGQVYRDFAAIINDVYKSLEVSKVELLRLTIPELEIWILAAMADIGQELRDTDSEFFSAGVDSLKAIQLRTRILKQIDLGGRESECTSMIVFDSGTPAKLARSLYAIRLGISITGSQKGNVDAMESLIHKFSAFTSNESAVTSATGVSHQRHVVITGATGFLGAHILDALSSANDVREIYCLLRNRADGHETSSARLERSLQDKGLSATLGKIKTVYADPTQDDWGLERSLYEKLKSSVTDIIHCAWPVNFTIPLPAFEPQIQELHNLLTFSIQSVHRAQLFFCSSIGVAQSTQGQAHIASTPIPRLSDAAPTGYAQSKLVGERVLEIAVSQGGARASILRIGQIVPGMNRGTKLWNPNEAVPLMIRSARKDSAGALPILSPARAVCSWIPVDTLADTILDLAGIDVRAEMDVGMSRKMRLVYNIVNPRTFHWQRDLLPAIQKTGLDFDIVSWAEWLQRLEGSSDDVAINPSKKLLDFWRGQANDDHATSVTFDTGEAESVSPSLRAATCPVDGAYIGQIVDAWQILRNDPIP